MIESILQYLNINFISQESLFITSFLGATLLAGGLELVILVALVKQLSVHAIPQIVAIATIGNTLGGATNYIWGYYIDPEKVKAKLSPKAINIIERYGSLSLLISWFPIIGDALCFSAGLFRCNPYLSMFYMALGKGVRYYLIAIGISLF